MSDQTLPIAPNEIGSRTEVSLAQSDKMIRDLLEKLPVEVVLSFKKHMLSLHVRQIKLVDSILAEKGYVQPSA